MTRTPRMSRQELAVRVLLVWDAMPIPERLLLLVYPLYVLFIGAVMVLAGTNALLVIGLLGAVAGMVHSVAEIWREVRNDDNFEWEETSP
jgi:hypothetical protein